MKEGNTMTGSPLTHACPWCGTQKVPLADCPGCPTVWEHAQHFKGVVALVPGCHWCLSHAPGQSVNLKA